MMQIARLASRVCACLILVIVSLGCRAQSVDAVRYQIGQTESQIDAMKQQIAQLSSSNAALRNRVTKLRQRLAKLNDNSATLSQANRTLQRRLGDLKGDASVDDSGTAGGLGLKDLSSGAAQDENHPHHTRQRHLPSLKSN